MMFRGLRFFASLLMVVGCGGSDSSSGGSGGTGESGGTVTRAPITLEQFFQNFQNSFEKIEQLESQAKLYSGNFSELNSQILQRRVHFLYQSIAVSYLSDVQAS